MSIVGVHGAARSGGQDLGKGGRGATRRLVKKERTVSATAITRSKRELEGQADVEKI